MERQEKYSTNATLEAENERLAALVSAVQAGVPGVADQLLRQFQGLLLSVAGRYRDVASFQDAYQEASMAFWVAMQSFDAARGVPFTAYAVRKVHGDVRTAMRRLWTHDERVKYIEETALPDSDVWDKLSRRDDTGGRWMADVHEGSTTAGAGAHGLTGDGGGYRDVEERMMLNTLLEDARLSQREAQCVRAILQGQALVTLAQAEGVGLETVRTWRKRALRKLRTALLEADATRDL